MTVVLSSYRIIYFHCAVSLVRLEYLLLMEGSSSSLLLYDESNYSLYSSNEPRLDRSFADRLGSSLSYIKNNAGPVASIFITLVLYYSLMAL